MGEYFRALTKRGRVTVPAEVRRELGLKEGDRVAFVVTDPERQEASLRPARSVAERTHGVIAPRRCPEDFGALRRQFEDDVAAEALAEAGMRPSTES